MYPDIYSSEHPEFRELESLDPELGADQDINLNLTINVEDIYDEGKCDVLNII